MSTLIKYKGYADILVALILSIKPAVIYNSVPTRALAGLTGLHLSNAAIAPGFNQSIACMVASIGVGEVVAAKYGMAALPSIAAMNLTWAFLGYATCLTPREWGLGNATTLMTSINHTLFGLAMFFTDRKAFFDFAGFKTFGQNIKDGKGQ